jgi:hypothetical protein
MRPLNIIARDIARHWPDPYYAARPYLLAMSRVEKITDTYYYDSASSIVRYFLSNAGTWRGPEAHRIKAELKEMLK